MIPLAAIDNTVPTTIRPPKEVGSADSAVPTESIRVVILIRSPSRTEQGCSLASASAVIAISSAIRTKQGAIEVLTRDPPVGTFIYLEWTRGNHTTWKRPEEGS